MDLLLVALLACASPRPDAGAPPEAPAAPARVDVRALSFPAAWLAERVGGARVDVTNVAPAGEDPPAWQPPADVVAELADADLIVANGAGYEAWTATATLPERKVVRTADGLDLITLPGVTHSHGKGGAHSHAGVDPHTWADPGMLLGQARALRDRLVTLDPDGTADYDAALAALQADVTPVDEALAAALAPARGRKLAASHPAFNYLARRYGLDLTSFGLDPEGPADATAQAEVAAWAAAAGPEPILLWEAAPSAAATGSLPAGVRHVTLDPLEQPPAGRPYDWIAQSRQNIKALSGVFGTGGSTPAPAGSTPTSP